MTFELIHKPTFTNQLLRIPRERIGQVLDKIERELRADPAPHDPVKKKLHGYKGDVYRLRSGDYRVLYTYGDGWVTLLGVDDRKDVYRGEQLVAEEPEILIRAIPSVDDWLEPKPVTPAWSMQRAQAPRITPVPLEAPMDLPMALTPDLLRRLQIPAAYLDTLCACATFDDLFAAQIPEYLRERLFDNLTATNPDQTLNQPSFVTGSVDNLLRFTEGKLTAFLLQLSPEQERFVTRALHAQGPTLLKGGPGSGKSTIALYRTQALVRDLASTPSPRILFTTYTNALVTASRQLLETLLGADVRAVEVRTVDSLLKQIASPDLKMYRMATRDDLAEVMAAAVATVQFHGDELQQRAQRNALAHLSPEYVVEELLSVIEARRLMAVQQYLQAGRPGRRVPLNTTQRTALWRLRERFDEELNARGLLTWERIRSMAADRVAAGGGPAPYDAVVVDEAQDLNPCALWTLTALCRTPHRLFITADANQSIYGAGFRWSDVHEDLRFSGRTGVLHTNFRSTREIGEAAHSYLSAGALDDEPSDQQYRNSGPQPAMRAVRDDAEEVDFLRQFLPGAAREFHLGIGSCAVLCPSERSGRAIASALRDCGVRAQFMAGRDLDLSAQVVKVITLQSSKGLEFPVVALAGFIQSRLSSDNVGDADERAEASARERRLLFVGMTRAMRALLVLTPARSDDPLFTGFDPKKWNVADEPARP
jgi:superfamily I DNA/RNA helicase/mRNA-degrading endonuclease RelE of RelBE toxin-antitoxin system